MVAEIINVSPFWLTVVLVGFGAVGGIIGFMIGTNRNKDGECKEDHE